VVGRTKSEAWLDRRLLSKKKNSPGSTSLFYRRKRKDKQTNKPKKKRTGTLYKITSISPRSPAGGMEPSSSLSDDDDDELDVTATVGAAEGVSLELADGLVVVVASLTAAVGDLLAAAVVEFPAAGVGCIVVVVVVGGVCSNVGASDDCIGTTVAGLFVVIVIVGDIEDDTAEGERGVVVVGATEGCGTAGSGGNEVESGV
jgi:hypothetical protein